MYRQQVANKSEKEGERGAGPPCRLSWNKIANQSSVCLQS